MALSLREADITRLLKMPDVIGAVEDAFRQRGRGRAVNRPRQRITTDGSVMHVMSAALPDLGVMGLKAYSTAHGTTRFVCMLYSTETDELLAVMEANRLGQLRTVRIPVNGREDSAAASKTRRNRAFDSSTPR